MSTSNKGETIIRELRYCKVRKKERKKERNNEWAKAWYLLEGQLLEQGKGRRESLEEVKKMLPTKIVRPFGEFEWVRKKERKKERSNNQRCFQMKERKKKKRKKKKKTSKQKACECWSLLKSGRGRKKKQTKKKTFN